MTVIYELPPEQQERAWPVYAEACFDRAQIDAVFEGRQPGRVFVDDPEQPRAALLCRTFGYYVAGDPGSTAMRGFIRDAPPEPGVFQDLYGYVPDTDAWQQALLDDHGDLLEVMTASLGLPPSRTAEEALKAMPGGTAFFSPWTWSAYWADSEV